MKRRTWLIILVVLIAIGIIGGGIGWNMYNEKVGDASSEEAEFKVTATDLFQAYETDEQAANQKYNGHFVEVTGEVVMKDKEGGSTNLTLDGGGMMGGVRCDMAKSSEKEAQDVQKGDKVTVRGEVTGMLMDVVLTRCVLVEEE